MRDLTPSETSFLRSFTDGRDPFVADKELRADHGISLDEFHQLWDWAKINKLLGPIFVQATFLNAKGKSVLEKGKIHEAKRSKTLQAADSRVRPGPVRARQAQS